MLTILRKTGNFELKEKLRRELLLTGVHKGLYQLYQLLLA